MVAHDVVDGLREIFEVVEEIRKTRGDVVFGEEGGVGAWVGSPGRV